MIEAEHEAPRPPHGQGFSDSVSFSFGDPEAQLYGLARLGLAPGEDQASALAVLFSATDVAAARAQGGVAPTGRAWDDVAVAGVRTRTLSPLDAWQIEFVDDDAGFDLRFSAVSAPIELGVHTAAARASGVEGYEQMCQVEGEVTVSGERRPVRCLGQRGHGWGAPSWERIELARTLSAWLEGPRGVAVSATRCEGASAHGEEALSAFLVEPGEETAAAIEVADPRLSTTYDAQGRQRRAGLELWVGEDDEMPRRLAGEVACGTSLELGRLRLECSFFHWRMEGRSGTGRYDVLRRA